jgi:hypothetical protein
LTAHQPSRTALREAALATRYGSAKEFDRIVNRLLWWPLIVHSALGMNRKQIVRNWLYGAGVSELGDSSW